MNHLSTLATPCLILDADRMERNIARLRTRLGWPGRGAASAPQDGPSPWEVARRVMIVASGARHRFDAQGGRAVRGSRRAGHHLRRRYCAGQATAGARVARQRRRRCRSPGHGGTGASRGACLAHRGDAHSSLIEIDRDGHRSGVLPHDKQRLVEIGRALEAGAESWQRADPRRR